MRVRDGELTVSNGGSVIGAEDLGRLTQPFERLGRGSGTGPGLSIVKSIADAQGGACSSTRPPPAGWSRALPSRPFRCARAPRIRRA